MDKVISMSERMNDGTLQTPRQALEDALEDIGKNGAFKEGRKLLILSLDDTQDNYSVTFIQAGMRMSECMALCEVSKTIFLKEMEYI